MTVRFLVYLLMKINNMTKDKNIKTAVPELRFPEFKDDGEWKEKKLGEIGKASMCKRILKHQTTNIGKNNIPFFKIGTFGRLADAYISEEVFSEFKQKYSYPNKGDILISASGTIGRLVVFNGEKAYFQDSNIVWIANNETFVLNVFLYQYYKTIKWKTSDGGIINRLYNSDLESILVVFPSTREQQKIADCLSSLDDLINAVADKIEALRDHKKGLMQRLFPAEGQAVPKFRFPEFEDDGEWKEKTLGKVATFINGRAYKQDELLECGKYRVLRVGNFFSNNKWYYSDLELNDNKFCDKGDLLYAWSASFGPRIWNEEKVIYHYHIWKVIENNNITKDFLYFLLGYETSKIKNQQANGLGLMHITKNSIENWNTFIPKDKKEQQKIADCLSTLDNEIKTQSNKLEELKAHKKGLMQKLFPKI